MATPMSRAREKIFGRFAAQEKYRQQNENDSKRSVDGTADGLIDAGADNSFKIILVSADSQILPDSVKYNNGVVDGKTKNGKKRRHKQSVHFHSVIMAQGWQKLQPAKSHHG